MESLNDILLAAAPGKNEESVPDSEAEGGMSKQVLELALAQGEPLTSRGLCQPCVDMLTTGKGYCAVCYRKYIDDTPLLLPPPPVTVPAAAGRGKAAQALPTVSMSMGAEVAEEAQQMVCCDECNEWVHSRCEGIDRSQYESIANGTHPVWVSGRQDWCLPRRLLVTSFSYHGRVDNKLTVSHCLSLRETNTCVRSAASRSLSPRWPLCWSWTSRGSFIFPSQPQSLALTLT